MRKTATCSILITAMGMLATTATATQVCRQIGEADFGQAVPSLPAPGYVITRECPAGGLEVRQPAPITLRMSQGPTPYAGLAQMKVPTFIAATTVYEGPPPLQRGDSTGPPDDIPAPAQPPRATLAQPKATGEDFKSWTVRFDLGQSRIGAADLSILDRIETKAVQVTGFACPLGSEAHNLELSLLRARAVVEVLQRKGIEVTGVEGRGECCPVSITNLALDRRAVITEVKK